MLLRSILYSIILHVLLILIFVLEWSVKPHEFSREYAMVMDIVPISELTNIQVNNTTVDKKKIVTQVDNNAKPAPQKVLEPKSDNAKQLPATSQAVQPAKSDVKDDIKPVPLPKPKKDSKPIEPKETKNPSSPEKKANQPVKEQKKQDDEYSKMVLKSLTSKKPANDIKKEKVKEKDLQPFDVIENTLKGETNKEYNPALTMSISEIDAIRAQIKEAWNPIAFSGSGNPMSVKLILKLDKNGEILSARTILERNNNPSYPAFVDSVVRAAYKAAPLKHLPSQKYQFWRDMEIMFSSEEMMY